MAARTGKRYLARTCRPLFRARRHLQLAEAALRWLAEIMCGLPAVVRRHVFFIRAIADQHGLFPIRRSSVAIHHREYFRSMRHRRSCCLWPAAIIKRRTNAVPISRRAQTEEERG